MIDKLVVLGPVVRKHFVDYSKSRGFPTKNYEMKTDLRRSPWKLPAILYWNGRHDGRSKLELVHVSRLGLSFIQRVLVEVFGQLNRLKIIRIDSCVDLFGVSPWWFALNCHVPNAHKVTLYKGRPGISYYLQRSHQKTILVYDKAAQLRATRDPLYEVFRPLGRWTRLEIQLKGSGVPYRNFLDIHRYTAENLLGSLRFVKFRIDPDDSTSKDFLKSAGLRALVDEYGLQAAKKMIPSADWAYLKRKLLKPGNESRLAQLIRKMKEENDDWLNDRIRFPRYAKRK